MLNIIYSIEYLVKSIEKVKMNSLSRLLFDPSLSGQWHHLLSFNILLRYCHSLLFIFFTSFSLCIYSSTIQYILTISFPPSSQLPQLPCHYLLHFIKIIATPQNTFVVCGYLIESFVKFECLFCLSLSISFTVVFH